MKRLLTIIAILISSQSFAGNIDALVEIESNRNLTESMRIQNIIKPIQCTEQINYNFKCSVKFLDIGINPSHDRLSIYLFAYNKLDIKINSIKIYYGENLTCELLGGPTTIVKDRVILEEIYNNILFFNHCQDYQKITGSI